jgi:hypothetical protein
MLIHVGMEQKNAVQIVPIDKQINETAQYELFQMLNNVQYGCCSKKSTQAQLALIPTSQLLTHRQNYSQT